MQTGDYTIHGHDALSILRSTKKVLQNARYVRINTRKLMTFFDAVSSVQGTDGPYDHCIARSLHERVQRAFLLSAINFCYFTDRGNKRFAIEHPAGTLWRGGAIAVAHAFDRGIAEGFPLLDAWYLRDMPFEDARTIFRSANEIAVPLLEMRCVILREMGKVLIESFQGSAMNVFIDGVNAVECVLRIVEHFGLAFRDVVRVSNDEVFFYKKAQLCVSEVSDIFAQATGKGIEGMDELTAFADYRLPQLFVHLGLLEYSALLAQSIREHVLLPLSSGPVLEIRSATIWIVEFLRRLHQVWNSCDIDKRSWILAQTLAGEMMPYPRCVNIYF
jgi:hypothetical protein